MHKRLTTFRWAFDQLVRELDPEVVPGVLAWFEGLVVEARISTVEISAAGLLAPPTRPDGRYAAIQSVAVSRAMEHAR
jgi:hypothetical protein